MGPRDKPEDDIYGAVRCYSNNVERAASELQASDPSGSDTSVRGQIARFFSKRPARHLLNGHPRTCSEDPAIREGEALGPDQHRAARCNLVATRGVPIAR